MATKILRVPTVCSKSGNSHSTLYLRVTQGLWTKPVKIGPRASGWPDDEVDALIAARIAEKSDDEIRELVLKLEAARKSINETHIEKVVAEMNAPPVQLELKLDDENTCATKSNESKM